MALKHHPDKNPNNPEATEKVSCSSQSYFVLFVPVGWLFVLTRIKVYWKRPKQKFGFIK